MCGSLVGQVSRGARLSCRPSLVRSTAPRTSLSGVTCRPCLASGTISTFPLHTPSQVVRGDCLLLLGTVAVRGGRLVQGRTVTCFRNCHHLFNAQPARSPSLTPPKGSLMERGWSPTPRAGRLPPPQGKYDGVGGSLRLAPSLEPMPESIRLSPPAALGTPQGRSNGARIEQAWGKKRFLYVNKCPHRWPASLQLVK